MYSLSMIDRLITEGCTYEQMTILLSSGFKKPEIQKKILQLHLLPQ